MHRLFALLLFPLSAWSGEDNLHSLSFSYGVHSETLSFNSFDADLSPESIDLTYTFISQKGPMLTLDTWQETANTSFAQDAELEKKVWGFGVSLAYPVLSVDLVLSYVYSKPEMKAWAASGNRLEEYSETSEYSAGVSGYFAYDAWSLVPSLQLGFQYVDSLNQSYLNENVITLEASQSGWFAAPSLSLSYFYELNSQAALSPFLGLSWTNFFQGEGLTRTSIFRRSASLTSSTESDLETDSSGSINAGLELLIDRYQVELSFEEAIDLDNIGTQWNLRFGLVW